MKETLHISELTGNMKTVHAAISNVISVISKLFPFETEIVVIIKASGKPLSPMIVGNTKDLTKIRGYIDEAISDDKVKHYTAENA